MIDAHVHIRRLGANGCTWPTAALPGIHREFSLDDLRASEGAGETDRVILVQSQEAPADTHWLLSIADADTLVGGVVGWADLTAVDAATRIAELARLPKLCGLRPMVQDQPADWFDDPALDPALAAMAESGLVLDALVRPRHLPALTRLARRHPRLRIVVDHAAKPDFDDLGRWSEDMAALAGCPGTWCKLSGLPTELAPHHERQRIADVIAQLWSMFGAERLIWGSDWPVVTLTDSYAGSLDEVRTLVPASAQPAVFSGNAKHAYGVAA